MFKGLITMTIKDPEKVWRSIALTLIGFMLSQFFNYMTYTRDLVTRRQVDEMISSHPVIVSMQKDMEVVKSQHQILISDSNQIKTDLTTLRADVHGVAIAVGAEPRRK